MEPVKKKDNQRAKKRELLYNLGSKAKYSYSLCQNMYLCDRTFELSLSWFVGNVGRRFWQGRRMRRIKKDYLWFCCINFYPFFLNCPPWDRQVKEGDTTSGAILKMAYSAVEVQGFFIQILLFLFYKGIINHSIFLNKMKDHGQYMVFTA